MKVKKRIQLLLATLFMSFGLVANLNLSKAPEIKAEAASVQPSSKIYFRPNANWRQANARFSIWFFNGTSNDQFVELLAEPSAGTNLYSCLSPSTGSYSGLNLVRHDPSKPISWDSKWNQSGNLTFDTNSNIYLAPENNWGDGFTQAFWRGRFIPQNTTLYFRSTAAFMGTANRVAAYVFNNVDGGTQSEN